LPWSLIEESDTSLQGTSAASPDSGKPASNAAVSNNDDASTLDQDFRINQSINQ